MFSRCVQLYATAILSADLYNIVSKVFDGICYTSPINTMHISMRHTSVINMLDGCALSLPCHAPDELPVGLMVWAGAMHDDMVLNVALQIEKILQTQ